MACWLLTAFITPPVETGAANEPMLSTPTLILPCFLDEGSERILPSSTANPLLYSHPSIFPSASASIPMQRRLEIAEDMTAPYNTILGSVNVEP
ncbi:brain protein 44 [Moniliophthora roreri]|nr:brain protein 44 [Moniliophthora roreri]